MSFEIIAALLCLMFVSGVCLGHAAGYRRGIVACRARRYRVGNPE